MTGSCQQGPLYAAEERALAALSLPSLTVVEAQRLVDGWRELKWFRENFPRVAHVQVIGRKSNQNGSCGGLMPFTTEGDVPCFADRLETPMVGVVEMAPAHLNELFVIHEVLHPLCESRYGNGTHHPSFCRHYLELTYLALGSEAYQALYREFRALGIDYQGWSS